MTERLHIFLFLGVLILPMLFLYPNSIEAITMLFANLFDILTVPIFILNLYSPESADAQTVAARLKQERVSYHKHPFWDDVIFYCGFLCDCNPL